MGLLEDAIREHLDLKRKHGAPEPELERQEVEALGPARRGSSRQEPADEAVPADDHVAGDEEAPADEVVGPAAEAFEDEVAADDPHPVAVEPFEDEEVAVSDDGLVAEDLPAAVEEPEPDAALDEAGEDAVADHSSVDQPTELFDVGEALAEDTPPRGFPAQDEALEDEPLEDEEPAAADGDDEADVLEDTPDFLQDAPEHDRLWFEQKPPRDFDFD